MKQQRVITAKSLEEIVGKRTASSALRAIAKGKDPRIPDFEMLDPGDIILARTRTNAFASGLIAAAQEELGFQQFEAKWTHAMVYVGDLHVAESQKRLLWSPGTRVHPLTSYAQDFDMMICRFSSNNFTQADANGIARWALLDCQIGKRRYDSGRAWKSVTMDRVALSNSKKNKLEEAVICSEFALECLATGAAIMVAEYNDVLNNRRFYYPADFVKNPTFRKIDMEYLQLKE